MFLQRPQAEYPPRSLQPQALVGASRAGGLALDLDGFQFFVEAVAAEQVGQVLREG
jgi:hypothetical protein